MKGRGLVLHEPTRTRAAFSLTTMGCMDRAEGPSREAADIRSPSELPGYRCCCGASPLGSQETCSGLAAGSGGGEPRLGVVLPLMNTARHTQRQVPHTDLDTPLPLRPQTGTEAHSGGQGPQTAIFQPRDPHCPSEETSASPRPSPTNSTENK